MHLFISAKISIFSTKVSISRNTDIDCILMHDFWFFLTFFEYLRWLGWLNQNCFFMDWFYYNLIILIKPCKIPHKILDKILLFSRNQVFCLKIWKLWRAPTTLKFNIFCWNFADIFSLPMSRKECVGFSLFLLDLELFAKI